MEGDYFGKIGWEGNQFIYVIMCTRSARVIFHLSSIEIKGQQQPLSKNYDFVREF